jgi:thiamine pyrophosphokinase
VNDLAQLQLRGLRRGRSARGAVLVLNGATRAELGRATELAARLVERFTLVAVDGGLKTCRAAGRRPDLWVGDGDSSRTIPTGIPTVVHPTDKDISDLGAALDEVSRGGAQVVVVAGLLGGRLDHEWANLQELGARSASFAGILVPTGRGTVLVTRRGCRARTVPGRTVSLLVLGGAATVTLRGTRWRLDRKQLRPGSRGLSNVTGKRLDLTVHRGAVAVVLPGSTRRRPA